MFKNIQVSWIPRQQTGAAIKVFGYYLLKGLKAANTELSQVLEDLEAGRAYIGVAYELDPFRPIGCWVSDIRILDDNFAFATVYALSGERLPRWIEQVEVNVLSWAKENNCSSVRFFGKAAYASLVDDLEIIGKSEDGRALLFEKRVAA